MSNKNTVVEIKELIKGLGFTLPSGYLKDELLQFYQGAVKMKEKGISPTEPRKGYKPDYSPVYADNSLTLKEHLSIKGWGVTAIPGFDYSSIRTQLLDWLHETCEQFDPKDQNTWTRKNIPYNIHGIFKLSLIHI